MSELITASIAIGDRTYRLKVAKENEINLRHTVKIVNDKIIEYKTHFAGKDMQDYIAMVLIWLASEKEANPAGIDVTLAHINQKIEKIEQLIQTGIQ